MNFEQGDFKNKKIKEHLAEQVKAGETGSEDLEAFLYSLVTIFEGTVGGSPLYLVIQNDWGLFSSDDSCKRVLTGIVSKYSDVFGKDGIINCDSLVAYKGSITACVAVWETLKDDIKNHHRFTTDLNRLRDADWETLLDHKIQLKQDASFYRARIHYKKDEHLEPKDMGARERGDCPPGRANPEGIPYLYLSEEAKTTFYETRVNMHDVVSVGEFRILGADPLFVEDLTDIDLNDLEILDEDVVKLAKRKLLIQALSRDMSNPMRRFDSKIEYVPTQFICEYVQLTQNVAGIRFSSSVYNKGTNVVIFDPGLMHCVNVVDYNIKSLDIKETNA